MRSILHTGHQGVINIMRRARISVYWPNMGKELTYMSEGCGICNKYQNQQPAQTEMNHVIPLTPWTKAATDCFSIEDYLIIKTI